MIEADPRWPGVVFNTTCLIGPEGILYKYRKVNPWIPYEVHASPHDLEGYDEPLFPVADTPIGRIGCAICYDWLFPEAIRQLDGERRRGAGPRLGLHGPVGRHRADELVDDRQPLPRAREHRVSSSRPTRARACGTIRRTRGLAAARSSTSTGGCSPRRHPVPASGSSWRRSTSRALRHERATRRGHHMLAHLRTEAYPVYAAHRYPPGMHPGAPRVDLSYERNVELIEEARAQHGRSALGRSAFGIRQRLRDTLEGLRSADAERSECGYH